VERCLAPSAIGVMRSAPSFGGDTLIGFHEFVYAEPRYAFVVPATCRWIHGRTKIVPTTNGKSLIFSPSTCIIGGGGFYNGGEEIC